MKKILLFSYKIKPKMKKIKIKIAKWFDFAAKIKAEIGTNEIKIKLYGKFRVNRIDFGINIRYNVTNGGAKWN